MVQERMMARRFHVELIKPSHYDDNGYVTQWLRSSIPPNSPASVHGLKPADVLTVFPGAVPIERFHPLQVGIFRRKVRRERRPELGFENPLSFYPRRVWEVASTTAAWASLYWRHHCIKRKALADLARLLYMDEALKPVAEETALPEFVRAYADRIPRTHGAPVVQAAATPQAMAS